MAMPPGGGGPPGMKSGGTYEIQKQIRDNVRDAQSFFSDLSEWEAEMKKKDENLRKGKGKKGGDGMPAPRGIVEGFKVVPEDDAEKKKTKKKKPKQVKGWEKGKAPGPNAAGHTYDYFKDKWDKFDYDAAMDAASDEGSDEESEEEDEPVEAPAPPPPRRAPGVRTRQPVKVNLTEVEDEGKDKKNDMGGKVKDKEKTEAEEAEEMKVKGNEYFKRGRFELAKQLYSKSIAAKPTCVAYANRAMASLKLGHNIDAENDCTEALSLDPGYLKAWQRRGSARRALSKYREAVEDFEAALRLEPTSKALAEERSSCAALFESAEGLQRELLKPKAIHVELDAAARALAATTSVADGGSMAPGSSSGVQEGSKGRTGGRTEGAAALAEGVAGALLGGDSGAEERGGPKSPPAVPKPSNAISAAAGAAQILADRAELTVPKTGTEFETAWKALKGDEAAQARLLSAVEGGSLKGVFKDQITAPMLVALISASLRHFVLTPTPAKVRHGLSLLEGLSSVGRFDMAVMLIPKKEKQAVAILMEEAGAALAGSLLERLGAARKKFRM